MHKRETGDRARKRTCAAPGGGQVVYNMYTTGTSCIQYVYNLRSYASPTEFTRNLNVWRQGPGWVFGARARLNTICKHSVYNRLLFRGRRAQLYTGCIQIVYNWLPGCIQLYTICIQLDRQWHTYCIQPGPRQGRRTCVPGRDLPFLVFAYKLYTR